MAHSEIMQYPKKRIVRKKSKKKIFGKTVWESETEESVYPVPSQLEEEKKSKTSLKGGVVEGSHESEEKRREDYSK